jgi:hypothetical protein
MGWPEITGVEKIRTVIASVLPRVAAGHTCPLIFADRKSELIGGIFRQSKLSDARFYRPPKGGRHAFDLRISETIASPWPSFYTVADIALIVPRVLELTYTSHSMAPFAHDLGYDGPPFAWDEDRRALLRAELDAWYARAYGLTRDELRYILDPADVKGPDYPSETFRVLKKNEIARYGEYRTARLVLAAWDAQEAQPAAAQ